MDQIRQIEAHIDTTRERLGANFHELERRVDAVTDLRQQFEARPFTILGLAFTGGVLLAAIAGARRGRRTFITAPEAPPRSFIDPATKSQTLEAWDTFKGAAIGLAVSRLRSYIDELVPGFDDQFQRAAHRAQGGRSPI